MRSGGVVAVTVLLIGAVTNGNASSTSGSGNSTLLTLSRALSSSMVLQRAPARARLWGTDAPGAVITATPELVSTTADAHGRWSLLLPPQPTGPAFGTGMIIVKSNHGGIATLNDVLFGETWLCLGQSNMGLPLGGIGAGNDGHEKLVSWSGAVSWGEQELNQTEHYPLVRVTTQGVPTDKLSCSPFHGRQRCTQNTTMEDVLARGWIAANKSKDRMYGFSAVCWMYGRRLFDHLQKTEATPVPVGLVQIAVGGTAVELWSSSEALEMCDQRRATRMAPCQDPRKSVMYHEVTYTNATLYNSMLHPWTPMAVRGAIFYQVQANPLPMSRSLSATILASHRITHCYFVLCR
jgi:sialate O-acetylesterase